MALQENLIAERNEIRRKLEKAYEHIKELELQLAATKLKWQIGKPPKDGWYWLKTTAGQVFVVELGHVLSTEKWAGPIPEPEE